jgi:uncharacterized Zn finger protein
MSATTSPRPLALTPQTLGSSMAIRCEACGFDLFTQVIMFRKISAILSPTGREEIISLPVPACTMCGGVNAAMLPEGIVREPVVDAGPEES